MDSIEALSCLFKEEDITITQEEINQMNEETERKMMIFMEQLQEITNEIDKSAKERARKAMIKDICKQVTIKGIGVIAIGVGLQVVKTILTRK